MSSTVSGTGSSLEKGESLYNTALTLQAMSADIIVVRHPHSGAPHFLARHLDSSVINAGDGTHAHPTQALLDMYTHPSPRRGYPGDEGRDRRRRHCTAESPARTCGA